ncbi:shikimate dehydrogenase [Alicyclobacillus sp. ALC3]|uniref:shikimate dehydrogenase n=1 Tax=Alicyclobacillus sp. ALC3 TaxID=2796143 RepID=UPI0023789E1F|nr:shikimate dehydrogenase [Alicyclobacillus sp. ALC3]WDL96314.1 shikimate dehydrogenase [Alicyclobacillus sp. ALC3]
MGKRWFGVMGDPVMHSVSPAMMNAAFTAQNLDAVYLAFHVPAESLTEAVNGLRALGAAGVNVTIPHKQAVLEVTDSTSKEAELAGAANTLWFLEDGSIHAHNTDIEGWWGSVSPVLPMHWERAAVLGAGGASRAVLTALSLYKPDCKVDIVVRDVGKAEAIARQFADRLTIDIHDWQARGEVISACDLAVNTTSLGMWPHEDGSPVQDADCFKTGQVVQDLVYAPLETHFLRLARSGGATPVDGLGMLVGQGAASFRLWTGLAAPQAVMRQAAEQALAQRRANA